jgi:hypothetical protein
MLLGRLIRSGGLATLPARDAEYAIFNDSSVFKVRRLSHKQRTSGEELSIIGMLFRSSWLL